MQVILLLLAVAAPVLPLADQSSRQRSNRNPDPAQNAEIVKGERSATYKTWTAIAGLSLGLAAAALFLLFSSLPTESDQYLSRNSVWALIIGVIGLIVEIVGRGFSKQK